MSIPFDSVTGTVSDQDDSSSSQKPNDSDRNLNPLRNFESAAEIANESFAPQATRYAMSIVRCWSDAEEVVQEAYCRLIQNGTTTESPGESEHRAILFTTVRNLSIDLLRKQGRRKFEPFDVTQAPSNRNNENGEQLQHLESEVQHILKEMPSEWADAIQLKMNGELSYTEIAHVLNATHAQVRTWIYRARKQMAKALKRRGLLQEGYEHE